MHPGRDEHLRKHQNERLLKRTLSLSTSNCEPWKVILYYSSPSPRPCRIIIYDSDNEETPTSSSSKAVERKIVETTPHSSNYCNDDAEAAGTTTNSQDSTAKHIKAWRNYSCERYDRERHNYSCERYDSISTSLSYGLYRCRSYVDI